MGSEFAQNAAFHDDLAPHYDAHLTQNPYNRLAREAFVELVKRHVPPASCLLDFGCGTGIDALQYARAGYRVLAYDHSPGMLAQLEHRCADEIVSGAITPWSEGYASFLRNGAAHSAPVAVTANFAVLNSIPDLEPLFDSFAERLAPPGWGIVSILNPMHWLKLKRPEWWLRGMWRRDGSPVYATRPYPTYLHFESAVLRAARRFHLAGRANSGRLVRYDTVPPENARRLWWGRTDSARVRLERALWQTPAHRVLGHFVFLVLRRDP